MCLIKLFGLKKANASFQTLRVENAMWRVPICLSDIFFRLIERKRYEHISRLGCIGEQQALLATSLVDMRSGKKNLLTKSQTSKG